MIEGLRYLQHRIPEFTHLSWKENWRDTKLIVQRSAEELRQEQEEIRRWEQAIVELRAITDGIEAANLRRNTVWARRSLQLYRMVGLYLRANRP